MAVLSISHTNSRSGTRPFRGLRCSGLRLGTGPVLFFLISVMFSSKEVASRLCGSTPRTRVGLTIYKTEGPTREHRKFRTGPQTSSGPKVRRRSGETETPHSARAPMSPFAPPRQNGYIGHMGYMSDKGVCTRADVCGCLPRLVDPTSRVRPTAIVGSGDEHLEDVRHGAETSSSRRR